MASPVFAREQSVLARVTVYWASGGNGSDACTRAHKCATGARLRSGHCAVDPKKIPYGSKVIFSDGTCIAVDTGRDVINRKAARRSGRTAVERSAIVIDRFFETKRQAMAWANAHPHFMTVGVLPPNERVAENTKTIAAAKQNSAPASAVAPAVTKPPKDKLIADNNRVGFVLPRRM